MREEDNYSRQEREFYRQLDDLFNDDQLLQILESKVDRLADEESPAREPARNRFTRFRWGIAGATAACLLVITLTIGVSESEFRTAGDSEEALAMTDTTAVPRLISMASRNDIDASGQEALETISQEPEAEQGQSSTTSRSAMKHARRSSVKVIRVEDETEKFLRMLGEVDTSMPSEIVRKISSSDFYLMPSADEIAEKINGMRYLGTAISTDATSIMEQAIINIRNI